jgi:hypothetical protein
MTPPPTVGGDLGNGAQHSASPPSADMEAVTSRSVAVEQHVDGGGLRTVMTKPSLERLTLP